MKTSFKFLTLIESSCFEKNIGVKLNIIQVMEILYKLSVVFFTLDIYYLQYAIYLIVYVFSKLIRRMFFWSIAGVMLHIFNRTEGILKTMYGR